MTERRDFKEYLKEQVKASETTAAEAYREAAELILSSGHQAAFEKRHLAEEAWLSTLHLGLVIEYLDEQTIRVENALIDKGVNIPENYELTFALSPKQVEKIPSETSIKEPPLIPWGSEVPEEEPVGIEEPETVAEPEQEERTNEEIFANIEKLADQLPDNLLYSSLTLSSDLYWDRWDSKGTRNNNRYITVKDYLSDKKNFLEFRARTDFLIEIENSLREKQEAFRKAESGEVESDVVDSWLAPEKIKIDGGIGTGSEITREQYNTKIEDLNLSGRGRNQLLRAGLKRVGVILLYSEEELRSMRNFGAVSYQELVDNLRERGLWPVEKPEPQEAEPHIEIPPEATLFEEPELTKAYEPWQGEEIIFRKGTLGKQLTMVLEGRKRPRRILEQKVSEVKEFKGERIKKALSKLGALEELTVENILSKQTWRLKVLSLRTSQINAIQDAVKTFANNLQYSPELKLLSSIYGERSRELIPPNAEKEEQLKDVVCEVVSSLTPRERKVLTLRYGLEDFREQDYKSVADQFNVTRERIRQIEAKALRKLRHPSRSRRLTPDFVEFVEKEAAGEESVEHSQEQHQESLAEPSLALVIRKNLPLDLETKEVKSKSGSVQVAENLGFEEFMEKTYSSELEEILFYTSTRDFDVLVGSAKGQTLAYASDKQFIRFGGSILETPIFDNPFYVARMSKQGGKVEVSVQTKVNAPEIRKILKRIAKTTTREPILKFEGNWHRRRGNNR